MDKTQERFQMKYKVLRFYKIIIESQLEILNITLNTYAKEGWKVAFVTYIEDYYVLYTLEKEDND